MNVSCSDTDACGSSRRQSALTNCGCSNCGTNERSHAHLQMFQAMMTAFQQRKCAGGELETCDSEHDARVAGVAGPGDETSDDGLSRYDEETNRSKISGMERSIEDLRRQRRELIREISGASDGAEGAEGAQAENVTKRKSTSEVDIVGAFLRDLEDSYFAPFESQLREAGCETADDLSSLDVEILVELGMKPIKARSLMQRVNKMLAGSDGAESLQADNGANRKLSSEVRMARAKSQGCCLVQ